MGMARIKYIPWLLPFIVAIMVLSMPIYTFASSSVPMSGWRRFSSSQQCLFSDYYSDGTGLSQSYLGGTSTYGPWAISRSAHSSWIDCMTLRLDCVSSGSIVVALDIDFQGTSLGLIEQPQVLDYSLDSQKFKGTACYVRDGNDASNNEIYRYYSCYAEEIDINSSSRIKGTIYYIVDLNSLYVENGGIATAYLSVAFSHASGAYSCSIGNLRYKDLDVYLLESLNDLRASDNSVVGAINDQTSKFTDPSSSDQSAINDFKGSTSQQKDKLNSATSGANDYVKPDVDDITPDIGNMVDQNVSGQYNSVLGVITGFPLITKMLVIVFSIALVSYVLFGKR